MYSRRAFSFVSACALVACSNGAGSDDAVDPTHQKLKTLAFGADAPPPPSDVSNRWSDSPDAAAFGQRLFFDAGFSGELLSGDNDGSLNALGERGDTGKVACVGCHVPTSQFSDTRTIREQTSLGAGWGLRRAPSLLDVAQSKLLTWDGHRDSSFSQPFGVIENAVEMNSSRLFAAEHVFSTYRAEYEGIFGPLPPLGDAQEFPALSALETGCRQLDGEIKCKNGAAQRGSPGDGAEYDGLSADDQDAVTRVIVNVGKALGAYERLLACGPSRFDRYMQGDATALDDSEQRGAVLFAGKAHCADCHSGAFFSDERFHNVGLRPAVVATVFLDANDEGAATGLPLLQADPLNVTGQFSDGDDGRDPADVSSPALAGAFRTPKLRCLSERPSFMHTAQLLTIEDVISFFDRGGDSAGYQGTSEIQPLGLTTDERADLAAFLRSLDGPGPEASLIVPPG